MVTGDDLARTARRNSRERRDGDVQRRRPSAVPERIASINAYPGAFPIAAALTRGADIVITGRCVDSAVTLAACIHAFGWSAVSI